MDDAHRHDAAVARLEIDIEKLGERRFARRCDPRQELRAGFRNYVLEPQGAARRRFEIEAEPLRQRGIDIGDAALRIGGEEAGRRLIEIIDDVLQMRERSLLFGPVSADILMPPQRMAGTAFRLDRRQLRGRIERLPETRHFVDAQRSLAPRACSALAREVKWEKSGGRTVD